MQKENVTKIPIEKNPLKRDTFLFYRSNSLLHHKDISNYNHEHRIRLDPSGESKMMDIRNQIPTNKIQDCYTKTNHLNYKYTNNANEKAIFQANINRHIKRQRTQNLLRKDKNIKRICHNKNNELRAILENSKLKLKNDLTQIIKDALKFSKNNNPIKSMLPRSLSQIESILEKENDDKPLSPNKMSVRKKKEFLYLIGVDIDNANADNVDIDINKCWDYILKLSKGRKIEDLLRYKVVNEIMSMTEKKSSEKAKHIYQKIDFYKKKLEQKKLEEIRRKKMEEEEEKKRQEEELSKNKKKRFSSQPKVKYDTKFKKKILKRENTFVPKSAKNRIKYNAYQDVNKIIDFIDKSKRNSQSKVYKSHFMNIQMTKDINNSLQNLIKKNEIVYK